MIQQRHNSTKTMTKIVRPVLFLGSSSTTGVTGGSGATAGVGGDWRNKTTHPTLNSYLQMVEE